MTVEEDVKDESHLFDNKLRSYEDKIVDFLLDIARTKRVNPKISTISSYLLIHGKLTQKELKELTGFSMGSISTFLSVMTGTGVFQKKRIPKSHTFTYSFTGELEDLTTKGIEIALSSFSPLDIYLKSKKNELKKYIEQSKKGAQHLFNRIDELLEAFEIYKFLFPLLTSTDESLNGISVESFKLIKREREVKRIAFQPEIYLIEDDMLNQLINSPMFFSRDPMFVRILGYFITRKYLTQTRLQRITGLSAGKISEDVNLLLEDGLIEKSEISPKGKITYGAESAGKLLLKFSRAVIHRMVRWDEKLLKLRIELENKRNNLGELNGYRRIFKICEFLLETISKYKIFIEKIDQILET
ncbi:MAG: MarR family transcriptional regulator [Promethearchaeota archaeon]